MAETVSGGALVTMIRAEVNAEDHMKANASPPSIALMSIPAPLPSGIAYQEFSRRASASLAGRATWRNSGKKKGRPKAALSLIGLRISR